MRKLLIISLFLAAIFGNISARQISEKEALNKAVLFGKKVAINRVTPQSSVESAMRLAYCAKEKKSGIENYYVFNRGADNGFIIISGEDRASEILGYSDVGSFDYTTLPENMKVWLDGYSDEIEYLRSQPESSFTDITQSTVNTTVAPLLGNIAWNQDAPYNNLCPVYLPNARSATGCVATAMAQILYYHRWPEKGSGTHSYNPYILYGKELSANFGETAYRWDLMKQSYVGESSAESKDAVATLMLHSGIAVEMEYGAQSGALSKNWCYALVNYFNYDKGVAYRNRSNYGIEDWESIIRNELNDKRPVYITGFSSSGGHAFVCDGYNTDGLFHINWGWGGMSNGYFRTTALTPSTQGIGGSDGGFNYRQSIITGIQRPHDNSKAIELISTEGLKAASTTIAKTDKATINLSGKVSNSGWESVVFDLGLAAFDATGTQVFEATGTTGVSLDEDGVTYGPSFAGLDFSSLSDGTYILRPMCRVSGNTEWQRIHDSYIGYPNYLTMIVDNDVIRFISPGTFLLSATDISVEPKVYSNTLTSVSATILNKGLSEYYGDLKVVLYDKNTKRKVAEGGKYNIDLVSGASTTVTFTDAFAVDAGEYLFAIADDDYIKLNTLLPIEIMSAPTQDAVITLDEKVSFIDNNNVPSNNLQLRAKVKCTQGLFAGYLYAYIYTEDGSTVVGSLDPLFVSVENDQVADIVLSGIFEAGVSGGRYLAYLINGKSSTYFTPQEYAQCYFTLSNTLGVEDSDIMKVDYEVYPNPASSTVNIKSSSPIKYIYVYSIIGNTVLERKCSSSLSEAIDISNLVPGQYLISIIGEQSKTVKSIIKK